MNGLVQEISTTAVRLVHALQATDSIDIRIAVLKQVARQYGSVGYPGFLKLLITIEESQSAAAKNVVADTLYWCLRRDDLPSGALSAWGCQPACMETFTPGFFSRPPSRNLGPVEYLMVWCFQRTQRKNLSLDTFAYCLVHLIQLVNIHGEAGTLYIQRLEAQLASDIDGAFTSSTKGYLRDLVTRWQQGEQPQQLVQNIIT